MISIIIPVYNEASTIVELLSHLCINSKDVKTLEFILVDGHSTDLTVDVIKDFQRKNGSLNLSLIQSEKGRGKQLHTGALHATGAILYFLHADSYPPRYFDQSIIEAVEKGDRAGCFRMKFKSWHPWLVIIGWFTRFSWKASRGGDQSQYITRHLYDEIGGYNTEIPFYEDYDLITRLYERDEYYVIPKWLATSARRYHDKGVLRLQWFYLNIYWRKYRGASIDELHQYYLSKCD